METKDVTLKGVVELQVKNLLALADYLLKLPAGYEHFSMASYSSEGYTPLQVKDNNTCGTSGCAIGHAPLLDLPINSVESLIKLRPERFGFNMYSNVFTFGHQYDEMIEEEQDRIGREKNPNSYVYGRMTDYVWDYLYAQYWDDIDNTPQGAAKRILFLLANPDVIETAMDELDDPVTNEMYKMYSEAELTIEDVKRKLNYV